MESSEAEGRTKRISKKRNEALLYGLQLKCQMVECGFLERKSYRADRID